jgi:hypothetical protein
MRTNPNAGLGAFRTLELTVSRATGNVRVFNIPRLLDHLQLDQTYLGVEARRSSVLFG